MPIYNNSLDYIFADKILEHVWTNIPMTLRKQAQSELIDLRAENERLRDYLKKIVLDCNNPDGIDDVLDIADIAIEALIERN